VTVPEPPTLFDYAGRTAGASRQKMEIGRDMQLEWHLKVLAEGKTPPGMTPEQAFAWQKAFGPSNTAFLESNLQGHDLTRWKFQRYMKNYLRCAKAVDDSLGRLVAYLQQEGIEDNTVVIYAADQSFYNGEHGWYDKRWIYEDSLRMPLVVRWPGVTRPGTRVRSLVQNIDYAPTLMAMAGLSAPGSVQGQSLLPLLRGETPADWRRSIYYHYYDPGHNVPQHYGLRTERFTLAHFPRTSEWELFDLVQDPQQLRSVYTDPAYGRTVAELKTELTRLRELYRDTQEPSPDSASAKGKGKSITRNE